MCQIHIDVLNESSRVVPAEICFLKIPLGSFDVPVVWGISKGKHYWILTTCCIDGELNRWHHFIIIGDILALFVKSKKD